jgi:hypothetical protein
MIEDGVFKAAPQRKKDTRGALPTTLRPATAHRLDQQIKRAFRHTYGAEAGLRTLVRLGASEMLSAGASKQAVRNAILERMQNHPSQGKPSLVTGESRWEALTKLVLAWADETCDIAVTQTAP